MAITKELVLVSMEHRIGEAIEELESAEWHAEHIKDKRAEFLTRIIGELQGLRDAVRADVKFEGDAK